MRLVWLVSPKALLPGGVATGDSGLRFLRSWWQRLSCTWAPGARRTWGWVDQAARAGRRSGDYSPGWGRGISRAAPAPQAQPCLRPCGERAPGWGIAAPEPGAPGVLPLLPAPLPAFLPPVLSKTAFLCERPHLV